MKLTDLHVVEGDPVKGGCHIKQMGDVLDLNKQAFIDGKERSVIPLSVQPTLEQAQVAMRELKHERQEEISRRDAESAEENKNENIV